MLLSSYSASCVLVALKTCGLVLAWGSPKFEQTGGLTVPKSRSILVLGHMALLGGERDQNSFTVTEAFITLPIQLLLTPRPTRMAKLTQGEFQELSWLASHGTTALETP